jgi:hypothetical protein
MRYFEASDSVPSAIGIESHFKCDEAGHSKSTDTAWPLPPVENVREFAC